MDLSFLLLYVVFGGAVLLGRVVSWRPRGLATLTKGAVVVLLGFLGAELSGVPRAALLGVLPVAFGFAVAILALTALLVLVLRGRPSTPTFMSGGVGPSPVWTLLAYLIAFLLGLEFGSFHSFPYSVGASIALYALLALVGFDLTVTRIRWSELMVPLTGAAAAAVTISVAFAPIVPGGLRGSLSTGIAFGWYSLAGQLVTNQVGTSAGMLAFTANFFREAFTIASAPYIGRWLKGAGLAALGGATSMDTTLYSIVRYGDQNAGTLGVAVGLILTVTAGLLIPAILLLPLP